MPGTAFSTANWNGYDEQSVTNPTSALTDFTLLIDVSTFSATWKSEVQSDAGDIRCTKGDDTELAYDLINWAYNAGAPTGWIRVKWSGTLAASGTQNVRVWAGYNAGGSAVAYDATETYGSDNAYDANWLAYFPDGGGTGTDRTSNGLDLTVGGSPTVGSGKVGDGTTWDSSTKSATSTNASYLNLPGSYDFTVMYWFNRTSSGTGSEAIQWDGTDDLIFYPNDNAAGSGDLRVFWRDLGGNIISIAGSDLSGAWHHSAFLSRASNDHESYLDGSSSGTSTSSGTSNGFSTFEIGKRGSSPADADLDDIQVHSVARHDDWIAEEYAQSNNQSTFWGTWAWTAAPSGFAGVSTIIGGGFLG